MRAHSNAAASTTAVSCIRACVRDTGSDAPSTWHASDIALQIPPLVLLAAAAGSVAAIKCAILVWCVKTVFCVHTPVTWWWWPPSSHLPPPPLPLPPDPGLYYSMLQLCDPEPGPVYVGECYCVQQLIYGLPTNAVLLSHALFSNGTLVPRAAGTHTAAAGIRDSAHTHCLS